MTSREKDSYKGENGKVAVIGGSKDYTGAPALSSQAALRTGCDLAKILTSEEVSGIVASYSENLIVGEYPSACFQSSGVEKAVDVIEWSDAAVIGPGLGKPGEEALSKVVRRADTPLVIDADAIEPALGTSVSGAVFTPHRGEKELIKEKYGSVESFVEGTGNIVLLKEATDKIYSESGVKEVSGGHPGMTVGGTGDVLTGIVASLISQGIEPERSALKAAEINGEAGEAAAEKYGDGLVATDLLEEIPNYI